MFTAGGRIDKFELPKQLLQQLRPLHTTMPDLRMLLRSELLSAGFFNVDKLAKLLITLQAQAQAQLSSTPKGFFGLSRLRSIIRTALSFRSAPFGGVEQSEESLLSLASAAVLTNGLMPADVDALQELISALMPADSSGSIARAEREHQIALQLRNTIEKSGCPLLQARTRP